MTNLSSVLFAIFGILLAKQGVSGSIYCNTIHENSTLRRLHEYLFCNYDEFVRSGEDTKDITVVNYGLSLHHFEVNDLDNFVNFNVWVRLVWNDPRFTWNPQYFGDISSIHTLSYMMWVPDIAMHSTTSTSADLEKMIQCQVKNDGTITCVPPMTYSTICDFDHTWWPYDMMNCSIQIASWSYSNDEISLRVEDFSLESQFLEDPNDINLEWKIVQMSHHKGVVDSKFNIAVSSDLLSFNILIKRNSSMYNIIYITFAIVLTMMTLMVLWLEPKSTERMVMANLNFVLHLLCLLELNWMVPFNGANSPQLLVFYEKSLILAAFSLILTSTLRYLEELNTEAPMWISLITVSILKSRVGQVFLVSILDPKVSARIEMNVDDNTNLMSVDKRESTWRYTSILIGWLAFLSILFVYVIMLIVSLPTSWSQSSFPLKSNL